MERAQDLHGFIGALHRRVEERSLERANVALGIARAAVPGRRHHALIVLDPPVLDLDPMAEAAARRATVPTPLASFGQVAGSHFSTFAVAVSPALMLAIRLSKSVSIISAQ